MLQPLWQVNLHAIELIHLQWCFVDWQNHIEEPVRDPRSRFLDRLRESTSLPYSARNAILPTPSARAEPTPLTHPTTRIPCRLAHAAVSSSSPRPRSALEPRAPGSAGAA